MPVFAGLCPGEAKKKEIRHHQKEEEQVQLQQNLILDSCCVKEARKEDAV